ncbi:glutamine amidotransferase [Achromobacter sp. K91]|uniref:GMP synthase [glutamine-hydrolyzing] n=1 Tax=Achromobacter aegrifaciens TaxID=1287736 RepID=A0AAD2IXX4_ACHAE|nr:MULTISPECIES: glutamine amidotransferase [Achromobacter]MBD9420616.1 glutamine amidotransferase [Achromobacter sp. ACM04]MBD9430532.1 glutamine amidotransferase [Achromobacter sp. ACM03]RIJ03165.1 glutamine amidotransferase [Achromobacter sp. K91]CUI81747.1 GMP synthase [glutamine-hydrolyzing] [Achromobacter aegrifaciens]
MSLSALAIRHVPFEDLGILAPVLADRGYSVRYLEAGVDAIDSATVANADLVVILGGPIGVYETGRYPFLEPELRAIAQRLRQDKPTLGICLGAQLMAAALGADVVSTGRAEIGYAPLTLTQQGQDSVLSAVGSVPVLHWHGDQFAIPEGAARLAETPGFPNQAFALGPRILGLQFHLEADSAQIERWLIGHACELSLRQIDPAVIREDARRYGPQLEHVARQAIEQWLDQI